MVSASGAALPVSGATDKWQPLWSIGVAWEQVEGLEGRGWGLPPFFGGSIVYIILLLKTADVCTLSLGFSVNRFVVPDFLNQKIPVFDYYHLKGFPRYESHNQNYQHS